MSKQKAALADYFNKLKQQYPMIKDWKLSYDHAKRRAGICYFTKKTIKISSHHIELNSWPTVLDTLIHEVAHAIAWVKHRDRGHGPYWQRWVVALGGKAEVTGDFTIPSAKWVLVYQDEASQVVEKIAERHRRNKHIKHYAINGCPQSQGKLYYLPLEDFLLWEKQKVNWEQLRFQQ